MVFTLFRRALANSKDHMSMSVRKIQMNETESKNDHLVITHQPFLLHDFFPPKHMASESISRAQDTRKHSRSSNSLICIHFVFSATALKSFPESNQGVSMD